MSLSLAQDGGVAHFCFRRGVRHGPFYRRGGEADPQVRAEIVEENTLLLIFLITSISQKKFSFPHVRNGSETVGAYLEGRPSPGQGWWQRSDHLQVSIIIHYSGHY